MIPLYFAAHLPYYTGWSSFSPCLISPDTFSICFISPSPMIPLYFFSTHFQHTLCITSVETHFLPISPLDFTQHFQHTFHNTLPCDWFLSHLLYYSTCSSPSHQLILPDTFSTLCNMSQWNTTFFSTPLQSTPSHGAPFSTHTIGSPLHTLWSNLTFLLLRFALSYHKGTPIHLLWCPLLDSTSVMLSLLWCTHHQEVLSAPSMILCHAKRVQLMHSYYDNKKKQPITKEERPHAYHLSDFQVNKLLYFHSLPLQLYDLFYK